MGAPYTTAKRKTEDAVEALIQRFDGNDLSGVTLYKGASLSAMTGARVEIVCDEAEPEIHGDTVTGNFWVTGSCTVVSNKGDKSRAQHTTTCGVVEDILMRDDVVDQVNSLGVDDYALRQFFPGACVDGVDGGEFRSEYQFRAYCRPSTAEANA